MNLLRQSQKLIKELNYILLPKHKKWAIPLFIGGVISAFLELIGVTVILPFVQAIINPEKIIDNRFVKGFFESLNIKDETAIIVALGMAIILVYILKNLFMVGYIYFQNAYSTQVRKDLALKTLKSFLKRPYVYYTNVSYAEIERSTGEDADRVFLLLKAIIEIMTQVMYFVFIASYIIVTETVIAIGVISLIFLTMCIMVVFFKPIIKRLGKKNIVATTERNKVMYQIIQGIKDIYVSNRHEIFIHQYDVAYDKNRITTRNFDFLSAIPDRIVEGLCVSGLIGIILIRLSMGIDIADFVPRLAVFAMATFKLLPAIGGITGRINTIIYSMPQLDNMYTTMKAADEYMLMAREYNMSVNVNEYDSGVLHFKKCVNITNVFWKYECAATPTLIDVNMSINKGESVGLIGASGAGKTTLTDILLGLYRPQKGSVRMDGIDIFTIPNNWSNIVSYVQQSVFLIDDTVRANVAFGIENPNEIRIWQAIEKASLGEFIRTLPEGLDTVVGERGIKFSGGQRQRIAIARALYNEPEILVLDEATAALDNETEKYIMESIESLKGKVTMIIVAHRLTTIRNCDRVFSIEDGVAVEKDKSAIFGET